jgi:hypothetical protein
LPVGSAPTSASGSGSAAGTCANAEAVHASAAMTEETAPNLNLFVNTSSRNFSQEETEPR